MKAHLEAVRQLYGPNHKSLIQSLTALGESLQVAAVELSRDCTLERVDLMLDRLKGAQASLVHLRKSLISERGGVHRWRNWLR
jgi:site-specific recombinase